LKFRPVRFLPDLTADRRFKADIVASQRIMARFIENALHQEIRNISITFTNPHKRYVIRRAATIR
jgi:N-acyl-L-homoserine lactone synthetase